MKRGHLQVQKKKTIGYFEKADGGTIFLDEIGDMPIDIQSRRYEYYSLVNFRVLEVS